MWKALRAQGIFRGHGPAPKVAFLYPGQGSQYVNMLKPLRAAEPIVAETFAEADRIMTPLLGKPLSEFIFVDKADADAVAKAEDDLRQTAITQPAVLATDLALTRLLAAYGITPDFTMGHSLGEYGALLAADALPFADALEAVSARGREMTRFAPEDKGRMAAVFAPLEEIERILKTVTGYVVIANVNSNHQAVIGGASKPVEQAMEAFQKAGYDVSALSVSHAFHTSIVASASEPLRRVLAAPASRIAASAHRCQHQRRVLSHGAGRCAADVGHSGATGRGACAVRQGPAHALRGGGASLRGSRAEKSIAGICRRCARRARRCGFALHQSSEGRRCPRVQSGVVLPLCGGIGPRDRGSRASNMPASVPAVSALPEIRTNRLTAPAAVTRPHRWRQSIRAMLSDSIGLHRRSLRRTRPLVCDVLERGWQITHGQKRCSNRRCRSTITGAALGLPGTEHIFDDGNIGRLLRGDQFIDSIPTRLRHAHGRQTHYAAGEERQRRHV